MYILGLIIVTFSIDCQNIISSMISAGNTDIGVNTIFDWGKMPQEKVFVQEIRNTKMEINDPALTRDTAVYSRKYEFKPEILIW